MASKKINFEDTATGKVYKTPVPDQFYKDFLKVKTELQKAKANNASPAKIKKLDAVVKQFEEQVKSFTENFIERPVKHKAEINSLNKKNTEKKPAGSKILAAIPKAINASAGNKKTEKADKASPKEVKPPKYQNTELTKTITQFVSLNSNSMAKPELAGLIKATNLQMQPKSPRKISKSAKGLKSTNKKGPKI